MPRRLHYRLCDGCREYFVSHCSTAICCKKTECQRKAAKERMRRSRYGPDGRKIAIGAAHGIEFDYSGPDGRYGSVWSELDQLIAEEDGA